MNNLLGRGVEKVAKYILWLMVILCFIVGIVSYYNGDEFEMFTKILMWSGLGILAICESIEKIYIK
jgi:magnesium-transporting ATPase (P-type)